jgi:RNA polymerase sigma-70 factor (ECF subfamily)
MQNHRSELDDDVLVGLAQNGDDAATALLIDRYYQSCLKVAISVLRDRENAEDEVQNACWKAFEHIGQFQGDAKFSTWLTRIVVNQCLMRLRQQRRSRLVYIEDTAHDDTRVMDLPADAASPEQEFGKAEAASVLYREIGRIPPLLRNVVLLRDLQELPITDVAEKLGISVAAAKSRLLRARSELRSRLSRYEGRLGSATLLA